jgi:alcohol dehydrogenase, propanol-preferring
VGIPENDLVPIANAFPGVMVAKQLDIVGSAFGSRKEAIETLEMAARGIVKTRVRVEPIDIFTQVFEEMQAGKLQGRVALHPSG